MIRFVFFACDFMLFLRYSYWIKTKMITFGKTFHVWWCANGAKRSNELKRERKKNQQECICRLQHEVTLKCIYTTVDSTVLNWWHSPLFMARFSLLPNIEKMNWQETLSLFSNVVVSPIYMCFLHWQC